MAQTNPDFDPTISQGTRELGYNIVDQNNKVVDKVSYGTGGVKDSGQTVYRYTGNDGKTAYTTDVNKLPVSISIDKKTGKINVDAPTKTLESSLYQKQIKPQLQSLSRQYKQNKDFTFEYTKYNEDGTTEQATTNIPDYINKISEDLRKYAQDTVPKIENYQKENVRKYGEKAGKMTNEQIQMSLDINGKAIPLPKAAFSIGSFGTKDNAFRKLQDKVADNMYVTVEDFNEEYKRGNFGREELAAMINHLDRRLEASTFDENEYLVDENGNYILDENGEYIYNRNSAAEAARMLALKNYILSHDPNAEWYQQVGDRIETITYNAAQGVSTVFLNIANIGEATVTLGNGKLVQNYMRDMDTAMEQYNAEQTLVDDSASTLATFSYLGGLLLGSWGVSKGVGALGKGITKFAAGKIDKALIEGTQALDKITKGGSAAKALSASSIAKLTSNMNNVSHGARFWLKTATATEKLSTATSVAKTFLANHKALGWTTSVLIDTIHDAVLFDSDTLREAISNGDQETRDYWLGQMVQNGTWWLGLSVGKGMLKGSRWTIGKSLDWAKGTSVGGKLNVKATVGLNRLLAKGGDMKAALKDKFAGGKAVEVLKTKIDDARNSGKNRKAKRLANKLEILEQNETLRNARRELGNMELDWDDLKLTDKSAQEYLKKATAVRLWENSVDTYKRSISFKRNEMIGQITDPSTGKKIYINPTLAGANIKVTNSYAKLADLTKKYNLTPAKDSFISQDTINYIMSRYELERYSYIANSSSPHSADAAGAVKTLRENLDGLSKVLPDEIKEFADGHYRAYIEFYSELNQYGTSQTKNLLDRARLQSYEGTALWQDVGYMPSIIEKIDNGKRVIDTDGKIQSVIEQEWNSLTYNVQRGQNYVDPELVRQSRINRMAQAEVNKEMLDAYVANTGASFIQKITGEETSYAEAMRKGERALNDAIEGFSYDFSQNFDVELDQSKTVVKNKFYTQAERTEVVNMFGLDDTRKILYEEGIIATPTSSLVQDVTEENFDDWFNMQNKTTQNYIKSQLEPLGARFDDTSVPKQITTTTKTNELKIPDEVDAYDYISNTSQDTIDKISKNADPDDTVKRVRALDEAQRRVEYSNMTIEQREAASLGKLESGNEMEDPIDPYYEAENIKQRYDALYEKYGDEIDVAFVEELAKSNLIDAKYVAAETTAISTVPASNISSQSENFRYLQKAIEISGDDFEAGLQRAWIIGDKKMGESAYIAAAARNLADGRKAFFDGVEKIEAENALKKFFEGEGEDVDTFIDDLYKSFDDDIDRFVNNVLGDKGARSAIDMLGKDANAPELSAQYLALKNLQDKGLDNVHNSLRKQVGQIADEMGYSRADAIELENKVLDLFDTHLQNKIDDAANSVKAAGGTVVNQEEMFDEVARLHDDIMTTKNTVHSPLSDTSTIMYLDGEGRTAFAQVDPSFASLYNRRYNIDAGEANLLVKFNAATSKMFRWGTTSVNFTSFGNQLFRDFGNAVLVGGSWNTIKTSADNLKSVWGENVVNQIKAFDPSGYDMRQIEEIAKAAKVTVEEASIMRELSRGAAISPSSTERQLYKDLWKKLKKDSNTKLDNMQMSLNDWVEKLSPDRVLNGKRENYLRNRVFASSFNDALNGGYNLEQARAFATFAMNNATTNFGRQIYHLQSIAESTPYFSAAINGTKSFWRMWTLDPVGITGRITGGLIIPTMALIGMSMADEESREIYRNIPEYEKNNSLVFLINKQKVSIPIPQEIGTVIAPVRQFVEYLNGANKNDFWELMMNDALGFLPYNFQGFSTIDMDQMISDPTLGDRINRGFARLFSTMAPVPLKSAYMLGTGTDPYSGKKLRDVSYWYWNEESGSTELMDYSQQGFARVLANSGFLGTNATVWQKVLSGTFGQTGANILDDLLALFTKGPDAALASATTNFSEAITKPFTSDTYSIADSTWRRSIAELTDRKNQILNDEQVKVINEKLKFEKDPEKRKKLLAERQNFTNEFYQAVVETCKRLETEYSGEFDRYKLGAVVQLLNFDTDVSWQTGSQYSSDTAQAGYYDGRTVAYQMMDQMGITTTDDFSVFGYIALDPETGEPVMKYSTPVSILDYKYTSMAQRNLHESNINALIKEAGLKDAHDSITAQIEKLYDGKKKLSKQDKASKEAIQINWNAQLAKTIAPYVAEMTPEAAINNTEVLNAIYPYIEVPDSWKTGYVGKHGNSKRAYYESWIKSMFSVNDPYKGQY